MSGDDPNGRTEGCTLTGLRPTVHRPGRRWSVLLFVACGAWLVGLGSYFALLRPPLLPEDPRYIGNNLAQIQAALPGLGRWLNHVFNVMGGFMAASGLLMAFVALTAAPERRKETGIVLLLAGLATVVTMSWTNFAIDSNFKWLLLGPVLMWFAGIVCHVLEQRHDIT
jgi:hypothetical protein